MVFDVYCNGKPVVLILIVVVNKHYQAIKFPVTNRCLPGSLTIEAVFDGYYRTWVVLNIHATVYILWYFLGCKQEEHSTIGFLNQLSPTEWVISYVFVANYQLAKSLSGVNPQCAAGVADSSPDSRNCFLQFCTVLFGNHVVSTHVVSDGSLTQDNNKGQQRIINGFSRKVKLAEGSKVTHLLIDFHQSFLLNCLTTAPYYTIQRQQWVFGVSYRGQPVLPLPRLNCRCTAWGCCVAMAKPCAVVD